MKRTQLYIDYETYLLAQAIAKSTRTTISDLVRQSLRAHIKQTPTGNSLVAIAKFADEFPDLPGTPSDISTNLDHYLYGTPKRKGKK